MNKKELQKRTDGSLDKCSFSTLLELFENKLTGEKKPPFGADSFTRDELKRAILRKHRKVKK